MFKHILLIFIMCFASVSAKAQTVWYKATEYAVATVHNGYYTWSDWYSTSVKMKIDWDNDYIIIYSNKKQSYIITRTVRTLHSDSKGGQEAEFRVLDGDGDTGGCVLGLTGTAIPKYTLISLMSLGYTV